MCSAFILATKMQIVCRDDAKPDEESEDDDGSGGHEAIHNPIT